MIDYFIQEEMGAVKLVVEVKGNELIDDNHGYFTMALILSIEREMRQPFLEYYKFRAGER